MAAHARVQDGHDPEAACRRRGGPGRRRSLTHWPRRDQLSPRPRRAGGSAGPPFLFRLPTRGTPHEACQPRRDLCPLLSDQQSEASIEDQLEVCRRYIERAGLDAGARSTRTGRSRAAAPPGPASRRCWPTPSAALFDVVVCEAVDRLGRKLADVAALHDRLEFRRIALHAVNMGVVTTMHVGLLGTMAQLYLSDLQGEDPARPARPGAAGQGRRRPGLRLSRRSRATTRRRGGSTRPRPRWCGGSSGCSPPARARARSRGRLNAEGVPGPDGRPWRDTTHPRPARARHRHAQQRALRRPAGLEPLQLRQGPAHRQAAGAAEPAGAVGAGGGAGAADRRRRALAGGQGAAGRRSPSRWPATRTATRSTAPTGAVPALGPAGLRRLRRRLHDHGQGPLRLRRAPRQGHLRQRPDHQPRRRSRAGCWTASSTGCWRPSCSRRSPAPTRRSATAWRRRRSADRAGLDGQAGRGRAQDRGHDPGDRGRPLPAVDEGRAWRRWRPRRRSWRRSWRPSRTRRRWRCTRTCRRLPAQGRGAGAAAGRRRAGRGGHGGDPLDDHPDRADAAGGAAAWRRCWRAISRGS